MDNASVIFLTLAKKSELHAKVVVQSQFSLRVNSYGEVKEGTRYISKSEVEVCVFALL